MRRMCVLGILMVSVRAAQAQPPTPAEIEAMNAAYKASLRGAEEIAAAAQVRSVGRQGSHPPAGPVSVAQLRHRPPRNAQKSVTRGTKLSQAGNHRRAAEEFERAVAADPGFAHAYRSLGLEYAQLDRFAEAEVELQRSLTLDPASWIGHYNLAVVFYRTGDLAAAERSLRRTLELSKGDIQAHTLLGQLLWRRAEARPEALEHLKFAARSSSEAKDLLADLEASMRKN